MMRRIAGVMLIGVLLVQPAFVRAASSTMEVALSINPRYQIEIRAESIPDLVLSTRTLAPLEVQLTMGNRTVALDVAWIGDRYVAETHDAIDGSDAATISIF